MSAGKRSMPDVEAVTPTSSHAELQLEEPTAKSRGYVTIGSSHVSTRLLWIFAACVGGAAVVALAVGLGVGLSGSGRLKVYILASKPSLVILFKCLIGQREFQLLLVGLKYSVCFCC